MKTRHLVFAYLVCCLNSCDLIRSYKQLTVKPREFYETKKIEPDTSSVAIDFAIDYKVIEKEVNIIFNEPVVSSGKEKFDKQYRAKTKNPAYDPVKWIKTKDPLHNNKKWIKIGGFKTKNPAYHPRKWIKTKNPKYNPNKWIYANTVRIEVGYNYQYSIAKRSNVKFSSYDNQTLRITVPIEVKGYVGFEGDGAKLFSLTKKKFKTKVDFHFDSRLSFSEEWCPEVDTNITIDWIEDPKIEIAGGVWLNLVMPADLGLAFKAQSIEDEIKAAIECEQIQKDIKLLLTPSSKLISKPKTYLNIDPVSYSLSRMYVQKSLLRFQIGTRVKVDIGNGRFLDSQTPKPLRLIEKKAGNNLISLNMPVGISYSLLEDALNDKMSDSLVFKKDNSELKVKKFSIYPSGDRIAIGVQQELKTKGRLFAEKGTIYLRAKPVISEERILELTNLSISADIDNELYEVLGAIFYDKLTAYIAKKARYDLKPKIDEMEMVVKEDLTSQLLNENGIDLEMTDIRFDISRINVDENLIVNIVAEAGMNVIVRTFN